MFELPELTTIARQMNGAGRQDGPRRPAGNTPHKFVWYDRTHDEFSRLCRAPSSGEARARGKWLFVDLEPD